jgi:hypothetical protein
MNQKLFFFAHTALALLVITVISTPLGTHAESVEPSMWLHAKSQFALPPDPPFGSDFVILNATFSQSFRFVDFNTTDTEFLLNPETNRQVPKKCML